MMTIPHPAALADAMALLRVAADPKAAQANLDALAKAADALEANKKELAEREKALDEREKAVGEVETELHAASKELARNEYSFNAARQALAAEKSALADTRSSHAKEHAGVLPHLGVGASGWRGRVWDQRRAGSRGECRTGTVNAHRL
jgi:septal ring factor EnvC (AmiA/AmiB activator)